MVKEKFAVLVKMESRYKDHTRTKSQASGNLLD